MSDDRMKTQSDEFDALANLVITWRTQPAIVDDTAFTRKTALGTLMLAVARYIADPGAYYRAQYERMRQDGSAT